VSFLQLVGVRSATLLIIMITGSVPARVPARACPFCGVATDVPHERQEGCIEALHGEIARMRGILDHLRPLGALNSPLTPPHDRAD
jgi:hypothetical protein